MDELLSEFLTETSESVSELDVELVQLEQNPNDQALLSNIFRLVHTIKGTCGFLGLPRLEAVAHAAENVLGRIRDGSLEVTPDAITLILESFDRIKWLLSSLEENEVEPEGDDQDLIDRLNIVAEGGALGEDAGAAAPAEEPVAEEPPPELDRELKPGEVSLDELERAFMEAPGPEDMAA
jgi:two-component system chemotaxis sensor kinase CheA